MPDPPRRTGFVATLLLVALVAATIGVDVVAVLDGHDAATRLGSAVLRVATAAAYAAWLYGNASAADRAHPGARVRPAWAAVSAFVPLVQMVAPGFAIARAWRLHGPGNLLLPAWALAWGTWLATGYARAAWEFWSAYDLRAQRLADPFHEPGPAPGWLAQLDLAAIALEAVTGALLAAVALAWLRWRQRVPQSPSP